MLGHFNPACRINRDVRVKADDTLARLRRCLSERCRQAKQEQRKRNYLFMDVKM
jgi:hypothetical protein